jgi:glutathione S-transferase
MAHAPAAAERYPLRHPAPGRRPGMKLYYFSGACSLASNISLREADLRFELVKVDRRTKKTADGLDFNEVNPKGYVPALRLDNGEVLTENVAVLQYIADRNPAAQLAPAAGSLERYRLMEWLGFINSEVHKNFSPLFRDDAHEEVKQYARRALGVRLDYLDRSIGNRTFLTGEPFTVADAYLFTVLGWGRYVNVDLGQWPQLQRYVERVGARPHVIEALKSERLLK